MHAVPSLPGKTAFKGWYNPGMAIGVEKAADLCSSHLGGAGEWVLRKPAGGQKKECYIARRGRQKYFLKVDIPAEVLTRLGEIGAAPRVIFSGRTAGLEYAIQELIPGKVPPDKTWLRRHADSLARVVKTYHQDRVLRDMLAKTAPAGYQAAFQQDLERLGQSVPAELADGLPLLEEICRGFQPVDLVPVHAEPNHTNMRVSGGRIYLVDWDECALSDPMRDIGVLLWWNFPPDGWSTFFDLYGEELTSGNVEKMYWFAARASLEIASWFAEKGLDGSSFLEDFWAAVNKQPNPKGYD